MPIVLCPEASHDLEATRDYYEAQQAGLGRTFLERVNERLAVIGGMPEMYGRRAKRPFAARLRQFQYIIYYRVHTDRIEVLAVMHGSRRELAWRSRA